MLHQFMRRLFGVLRGSQLFKEELVIEHLPRIVGQGAIGRFAHDVAQGHAFVLRVAHQLIEFVHIVLEVFAVVAGEGLLAHHGCQVAELIVQLWQVKWIDFHSR